MRQQFRSGLKFSARDIRLASASAAALSIALLGASAAQAADDAGKAGATVGEVVVTGSRIQRSTFTSPNPVTVINEQEIQRLNLTNAGDIVAQLPQNSNFFAGNNVGLGNFNVGAQLVNLRGLNPFFGTRTLTLMNTQRVVPTTTGGGVDVTLIPSQLIGRVDTETGGASAVYGSDAIAGVVNIMLDTKLEGLKAQVDYSQTKYGDARDPHASFAWGHGFANGSHLIVGAEFEHTESVGICSEVRSWCATNYALFTNPNFNTPGAAGFGQPHYILGAGGTAANQTPTGVLIPCVPVPGVCINPGTPLMQFNASGSALVPFVQGNYPAGAGFFGFQQGGDANAVGAYETTTMKPDVRKYTGLAHYDFPVGDRVTGSLEGWFARSVAVNPVANGSIGPYALEVGNGVYVGNEIAADNAYLTPAESAYVSALGGRAAFGRNMLGTQEARNQTNDNTWRIVGTLKGDLGGGWGWDAYAEYGRNDNSQALFHNVVGPFLQYATDAVKNGSGQIVCGVTIPGRTNPNTGLPYSATDVSQAALNGGCTPINLFGQGNATQQALDYAFPTLKENSTYLQEVVSGNVHGDLFQGWGAGAVKLAAGGEWRREKGNVTHDLLNQPFYPLYTLSYGLDYRGTIDVLEGYAELSVPVLKDAPLFKYLEVDGAIRGTRNEAADHSTEPGVLSKYTPAQSGLSITHYFDAWKVNFLWDVTDWLKFRGTRSRDVRAPQFRELFQSYAVTAGGAFGTVTNPWYVAAHLPVTTDTPNITSGGKLTLNPEKADTTTVGVVISPKSGWLQGFNFSADWYQIYINEPIVGPPFGVGAQNIVNLCYQGNASFCSLMTRDPVTNKITYVNNQAVNLGKDTTRGIDFEADYTLPLDRFGGSMPGTLNFRLLTSYLYDLIIDAGRGGLVFNYAGQSGPTAAFGGFNTSPKWQANGFVTYTNGPFSGTVQVRYVGSGRFTTTSPSGGVALAPGDAGYDSTNVDSISSNKVPAAWYVNLAGSYDVTKNFTVFANINNLFDKSPPMAPGGNGYPTNPVYFDTYGMTWKLGVRARF